MRGLATMTIRTCDPAGSREDRRGGFHRPGGMRTDRRNRAPQRIASRWVQGNSKRTKPRASSLSPLSTDLLITTRVRELAAAEAPERRDRQIAAVARLLRRAAGSQGAPEGNRDGNGER